MKNRHIRINSLQGYSGIKLMEDKPLEIKQGVNLIVGKNGSGKSNFLSLLQYCLAKDKSLAPTNRIETSFIKSAIKDETLKTPYSIQVASFETGGKIQHLEVSIGTESNLERLNRFPEEILGRSDTITLNQPYTELSWTTVSRSNVRWDDLKGSMGTSYFHSFGDDKTGNLVNKSTREINSIISKKIIELFKRDEIQKEFVALEKRLNDLLFKFLGPTNKRIEYYWDEKILEARFIFKDGENIIKPELFSTGEEILFNLIFQLVNLQESASDIICFDEPEVHMHEDMIKILVSEIQNISCSNPSSIILLSTHSTTLIELLATQIKDLNLIIFNENREVYNSEDDIDFIKALKQNGVWFSPLMISKKKNLFIENLGQKASKHKDHFLRFFQLENRPNIIPIGTGGNVAESQKFADIISEIVKTEPLNSKGIRDGDLWFKKYLRQYLRNEISLTEVTSKITEIDGAYIRTDSKHQYFFNFWEIENLYLVDELLQYWFNDEKTESLTKSKFDNFIRSKKKYLSRVYIQTFLKAESHIRFNNPNKISEELISFEKRANELRHYRSKLQTLESIAIELVEQLIEKSLSKWLPRKEIYQEIERVGFKFQPDEVQISNTSIASEIREILHLT